jgi:pyruvate/2-oxoglutarate dehydrogenase complex dihydrolipoamide dehydrogenase (E3) component
VVLGGGPIGCELAQSFARLGSQVTQVEMAPRLMIREDEDVSTFVCAALRSRRRAVLTGHKALRCERVDGDKVLVVEARAGRSGASCSTSCCAPWAAARG